MTEQELKKVIQEELESVLDERKKFPPKVHAKAAKIDKEPGVERDKAYAIAIDMYDDGKLEEKKKKRKKKKKKKAKKLDRCARIAKRKYKVWPSAYASGAAVKCRQGKIWKGLKEEEEADITPAEEKKIKKMIVKLRKSSKGHAKQSKDLAGSSKLHAKQADQLEDIIKEDE